MRSRIFLSGLALVAGGLAACGAGSDDDSVAAPATQAAPATSATAAPPAAPAQRRGVRLVAVGRFSSPLFLTAPRGDRRRLFVVEQGGRIMIVRGGRKLARPFLDIRSQVQAGGEQGLLGLAFDPGYAGNGRFYVYFTDRSSKQRLVQFRRRSADVADPRSARVVFVHDDPEGNHNGGMIVFGPDRRLYVGTGDGGGGGDEHGSRGNAQNLGSPLGKLLRIAPRAGGGFAVPRDNPLAARPGARGEVYSYGLRNPWRFSFDRKTGDLAIGDVGQHEIEEIDFVRRGRGSGANFGWRPFEGNRVYAPGESAPGHVGPVIEHEQADGWCSITGGYVVRDPRVPDLAGRYVYGDFCKGELMSARLRSGGATDVRRLDLRRVEALSSFGEDALGRVYAISLSGPVYRFVSR